MTAKETLSEIVNACVIDVDSDDNNDSTATITATATKTGREREIWTVIALAGTLSKL